MKLDKNIKDSIDKYFHNITAEELYLKSKEQYFFTDAVGIDLSNQQFSTLTIEILPSISDDTYSTNENSRYPLAS